MAPDREGETRYDGPDRRYRIMKALIDGVWHPRVTDHQAYESARARQPDTLFRNWISADGASGFKSYVSSCDGPP